MKFLIVMDAFKGCLSSLEAGEAVAAGIFRKWHDCEVDVCPIGDGGEGTVDALIAACDGKRVVCSVEGPYGEMVTAQYGILSDGTAVMEMAQAAGWHLSERRALEFASTFGVGMMIRDAVLRGCRRFVMGIGGSATNDGGVGMLQALGIRFCDSVGRAVRRGAIGLKDMVSIDTSSMLAELGECHFDILCDVDAPLLGSKGCSLVFGPQKGATPQLAQKMDQWMGHYADCVRCVYPDAVPEAHGAGAAGGLGFALQVFCKAALVPGLPTVAQMIGLEEKIRCAECIITGEGKFDVQSMMGKTPVGIANIAKKYHKPVIALVGAIEEGGFNLDDVGIDAIFSIQQSPCTFDEAMKPQTARDHLSVTAEQIAHLLHLARGLA